MARNRDASGRAIGAAIALFLQLPMAAKVVIGGLVIVAGIAVLIASRNTTPTAEGPPKDRPPQVDHTPQAGKSSVPWVRPQSGQVAFMLWNVENLFDDVDDNRNSIDEPYDNWFATDTATRQQKYDNLAEIILKQNGGHGPDVLVCVEVESVRAATLLKDTLNAKLPPGVPTYEYVGMKNLDGGRHIAPAVISKLPIDPARVALHGHELRILEAHIVWENRDLCVFAAHWTSQLRQKDGSNGEKGRQKYATTIYEQYSAIVARNPVADVLVCGDFNDTPDSVAVVNGLHMTGDRAAVVPTGTSPRFLGLLSGKPAEKFGTHYYSGPLIYDQIGVSAGMLDQIGWGCDPDSVAVVTDGLIRSRARTRTPWRFGSKTDDAIGRGYADHFPVVVHLKLMP